MIFKNQKGFKCIIKNNTIINGRVRVMLLNEKSKETGLTMMCRPKSLKKLNYVLEKENR